LQVEQLCYGVG